ncbi:CU044_2847 family protein [Streptomyces sp. TS71-3]|uniref:CU044_2847 family protein n=1 Tax=Streptomyces sp. TS71-3 TaxID=2733862 RepID=UPI001AFF641F|nr:CU044_2847 family protein [Streptomyces sp. TS71-3]GHJ35917.1 hypothetical protein Sm713_15260 [Streptomyces sp. TS71-3]
MSHIQEIELPDGTVVLARLTTPDVYGSDDQDVGVFDTATAKVEQLGELITAVGSSVLAAARAAGPDEAAVTFGVELTARSGRALAVLAEGEAKAAVQVTLTWHMDERSRTSRERADNASGAPADDAPPVTPTPRVPADGASPATPDDRTPGSASAHA